MKQQPRPFSSMCVLFWMVCFPISIFLLLCFVPFFALSYLDYQYQSGYW